MISTGFAGEEEVPLSVEIDVQDVICERFLGFGAEWDSRGYREAGISEEEFDVIRRRVGWMRLPVARIMMQCRWCYKGNGVMAWMLDDNSHPGFFWGLWANREKGMGLRPWFYPWSLLCRCFPPESRIVRTGLASEDVRVLAACSVGESSTERSWSFCIVNRANVRRSVRLQVKDGVCIAMNRYVYGKSGGATDENGFPVPLDRQIYDFGAGAEIECEAESVTVLNNRHVQ